MEIVFRNKAQKFIKKCEFSLYKKIKLEMDKIKKDPLQSPKLKGDLSPIRSHHFHHKRSEYRIAYVVENNIIIILIASREGFYEKL